jgi:glutamate formiminotransferase / 5-formyltetrahydrofolate cyclo-ligase
VLECVLNASEGRSPTVIAALTAAAGPALLDLHTDPDHHRSVLTLVGEEAPRAVTRCALQLIDVGGHRGVHPRIGAVDVVPFVPLGRATMADALRARDTFAAWAGKELGLPTFLYGPELSLPDVRRSVRHMFVPDAGPAEPHPTGGAVAVGARPVLVAYNIWLAEPDMELARRLATDLRGPAVRALAFAVGDHVQVSANLVSPLDVAPADLYDAVAARASIARAELVGLIPRSVLERIPSHRWATLDLADDATIEARLASAGLQLDDDVP